MAQTINEVQRLFIQEAARPTIETIIRFKAMLDAFVDDYDNQQAPITVDGEVINDAGDLAGPRLDAPNLTGTKLEQLRNFAASMSAVVNTAAEADLIAVAVRSVDLIRRGIA